MKYKLLPLLLTLLITCPSVSQNIFIDSNQVALFINGNSLWSESSQSINISGGVSVGRILDFGYQYGSVSIERENYYDDNNDYEVHSFLVSVILSKKKMQVSIDLSLAVANSTTLLGLGFGLARKYQLGSNLEAVLGISTGLAFNMNEFPQKQEFAFAISADLFIGRVVYFGPGIGYSSSEFFYGLNLGFVIPFSGKKINY